MTDRPASLPVPNAVTVVYSNGHFQVFLILGPWKRLDLK